MYDSLWSPLFGKQYGGSGRRSSTRRDKDSSQTDHFSSNSSLYPVDRRVFLCERGDYLKRWYGLVSGICTGGYYCLGIFMVDPPAYYSLKVNFVIVSQYS